MAPHMDIEAIGPMGANDPKIHPFHLKHVDPHLTHECLGVTPLTILNDSSIAARTSAQLCNKVTRLGTPSVHHVLAASECHLHRTRHVATQQPGLKPGELYHLGGPARFVVCSLHLPKII